MSANKKKKVYQKPALKKFGSVTDLTQNMSINASSDGMGGWMKCITPAPQIEEHRILLRDEVSQDAFRNEIFKAVKPGDVVLDMGTGSGLHAFFACQAGAKKVYAIDSQAILEIARETAELNGMSDRIEFVYSRAEDLELPEKVDVIITNIGFLNTHRILPLVARRLLKPGGRLVPSALELQFCLASAPNEFQDQIQYWNKDKFGLNFSPFRTMASNHPLYTVFQPDQLLSNAGSLGKMDLMTLDQDFMETEIELTPKQDGIAHGLGGWYRFWAGDSLLMTTEPPLRLAKEIWSEIFLPFDKPLELKKGETLQFQIGMYTKGSYTGPLWRWSCTKGNEALVDQCSFYATPLTKQFLEKIQ